VVWAGLAGGAVVADRAAAAAPQIADGPTPAGRDQAALAPAGVPTAAPVAIHGTAEDGSELTGSFRLDRFQARRGVLYAVGELTGTLGATPVSARNVRILVVGASNPAPAGPQGLQAVPTPGACSILSLDLGPLELILLGLRVALDPVVLLVEAIPGAGELLGNLLCAVAGLLDGGLGGVLGGLAPHTGTRSEEGDHSMHQPAAPGTSRHMGTKRSATSALLSPFE
jgi:hypothetical protein